MIWLLCVALIAAIALWPMFLESRRTPLSEAERNAAPGDIVQLSQGRTYVRWHGPVRGPVIIAIHGLTTPSAVFDDLAGYLGGLGYRVLTYDLYGRGLSDNVPGPQNEAFFLQQLDDVLKSQGLGDDLTLMGYSMGGAIAAAYAAKEPHRISRLILLASAGMDINENAFWRFARRTAVLGDWLVGALGTAQIRQEAAQGTPIGDIQQKQLLRRGYLATILSSRRHFLSQSQEAAHRLLGRENIPVTAIWGGQDKVIPLRALGTLAQWNRNTLQDVIPDADHGMPWRHAQGVAQLLRDRPD